MRIAKVNSVLNIVKFVLIMSFLPSCSQKENTCTNPIQGKAVLVAYRVSKHSHMWFQNPGTKQIYDISGVGGRREPVINLGEAIPVKYCGEDIIFDKYFYVREPYNRETRFICLKGYEYLY